VIRSASRSRPRQARGGSSDNRRRIIARCPTIVASRRWGEHVGWRIFSTWRLKIRQSSR
jgi:hypothetical protein